MGFSGKRQNEKTLALSFVAKYNSLVTVKIPRSDSRSSRLFRASFDIVTPTRLPCKCGNTFEE